MTTRHYTKDDLISLKPEHGTFVGIDSDGCVFDSMEIKQKQCFHPVIISHWGLEAIEKELREAAEFVNLYSIWRGQNRFLTLVRQMDLLRDHPQVVASGVPIPELNKLREWIDSGAALGNPTLKEEVERTGDEELTSLYEWSCEVNRVIEETVKNVPPFPWCRKSMDRATASSDVICVSQTPSEALLREWEEHDLLGYARVIAGQELGTKTEHLQMATGGKYPRDRVLMIGDAPGDRKAADGAGVLFYPVNPGHEDASWERFHEEAYDKFLSGEFAGAYAERVNAEFEALLPDTPPWEG